MDIERKTTPEILESDLLNWVEAFLFDRQSTGLSKNTVEFYRRALTHFLKYCSNFHIDKIDSIDPDTIRGYLINLENNHYSPGGIHAKYRALRTFRNNICQRKRRTANSLRINSNAETQSNSGWSSKTNSPFF